MIKDSNLFILKKQNLTIVTFEKIFKAAQEKLLYNNIIYNTKRLNQDISRLFLHFLIHEFCEKYIELKTVYSNVIFVIDSNFAKVDFEIYKVFSKIDINKFIYSKLKKAVKKIPIPIFITDSSIDLDKLEEGNNIEVLNKIISLKQDFDKKPKMLDNIKNYTQKNGLKQLANTYFYEQETKRIFY